jgi:hypothetical protein
VECLGGVPLAGIIILFFILGMILGAISIGGNNDD